LFLNLIIDSVILAIATLTAVNKTEHIISKF